MAVEELAFKVLKHDGAFEVRSYDGHIVAETVVEGSLENAGDRAFNKLFQYISGANESRKNIAMTAPVQQKVEGTSIAMTAPVGQRAEGDRWCVSFMMPATFTMENVPTPTDPAVVLRAVPPRTMATVRYSGFWSDKGYRRNLKRLESWMSTNNLAAAGEPEWARYNPPFTPWFLRRNEILIPVVH